VLLRQQDAYTPQHLGEVLQGLFSQSEASGSEFFHLPGWDGLEPTPTCASGPGDFKSVFDPDSPGSHTRKFIGFGTSRGSGRRIHSFKIHRDMQGRPVICSREHDLFGPYSDGLLIFKDTEGNDGLHPGVESIPGVDLHPNEDHEFVMQKVEKLRGFRDAGLIHPLQASWGSSVKQPMLQQLQLDGSPLQRMLMGGVMANDNFGHEAKVYRDLLSEGGSIYQVAKEFVRNNTTGKFLNLMHPEPEPWQYQHQYCAQAAQL
jgi:hypothetical protein